MELRSIHIAWSRRSIPCIVGPQGPSEQMLKTCFFFQPKLNSTDLMYPYGTVWGFTMTPGHERSQTLWSWVGEWWISSHKFAVPYDSIKMTYRLCFCMLSPAREKLIFLFQLVGIGQYFQQNRCCERYTTNYGRLAALLHNTCTFQSILTYQSCCCSFNLPWPLALIAGMSW